MWVWSTLGGRASSSPSSGVSSGALIHSAVIVFFNDRTCRTVKGVGKIRQSPSPLGPALQEQVPGLRMPPSVQLLTRHLKLRPDLH
ncbi:unnamed protein product [Arctogadus glacialis]